MKLMFEVGGIVVKIFPAYKHIADYEDLQFTLDPMAEFYNAWQKSLQKYDRKHLERLAKACMTHVQTGDTEPGKTIRDSSADYIGSLLGFNDGQLS